VNLIFLPYFDNNRNMEEKNAVKALAALAQASRLQLFRALVVAGPQGAQPGDLALQLDLAAATLSFHLKELHSAGLVSQERSGRNLIYRADFDRMNALLAYLTENCCQGQPCAVDAASANTCCD
jgi:ArsR family transcriptional regulator, arsenate/arsenite/antimonite-responsive transcriptional repressor